MVAGGAQSKYISASRFENFVMQKSMRETNKHLEVEMFFSFGKAARAVELFGCLRLESLVAKKGIQNRPCYETHVNTQLPCS